jgi:phosphoribosylamine--glycine ligase
MKVLILGSGGREHAMAWKLSCNPKVTEVLVMPGNPGMTMTPKVKNISGSWKNKSQFLELLKDLQLAYVIIGPEGPLAEGVSNWLREASIPVVGPSQLAAELEASKIFAKEFMSRNNIPTAEFKIVQSVDEGIEYLDGLNFDNGIVVKADALAGGKGVVVTRDLDVAKKTVRDFLESETCQVKTDKLLFEKRLDGKELSAFALCDGLNYATLGYACDYKRVFENDLGPNTGGMGGYLPTDWPSHEIKNEIDQIISKTLKGMKAEGREFSGFLFVGLMIEGTDVNVIEYNVRMGDPETQILLPLLDNRFEDVLEKVANSNLKENIDLTPLKKSCVHIVLTSGGYPSTDGTALDLRNKIKYPKNFNSLVDENIHLFFAGVNQDIDSDLVNSGGRVLGLSAVAETTEEARALAYKNLEAFNFKGMHYRKDIASI